MPEPEKTKASPLKPPPAPAEEERKPAPEPAKAAPMSFYGAGAGEAEAAAGRERLSLGLQRSVGNAATGELLSAEREPAAGAADASGPRKPEAETAPARAAAGRVERDAAAEDRASTGGAMEGVVADSAAAADMERRRGGLPPDASREPLAPAAGAAPAVKAAGEGAAEAASPAEPRSVTEAAAEPSAAPPAKEAVPAEEADRPALARRPAAAGGTAPRADRRESGPGAAPGLPPAIAAALPPGVAAAIPPSPAAKGTEEVEGGAPAAAPGLPPAIAAALPPGVAAALPPGVAAAHPPSPAAKVEEEEEAAAEEPTPAAALMERIKGAMPGLAPLIGKLQKKIAKGEGDPKAKKKARKKAKEAKKKGEGPPEAEAAPVEGGAEAPGAGPAEAPAAEGPVPEAAGAAPAAGGPGGAAENLQGFMDSSATSMAASYAALGKRATQGFDTDRQGIQEATPPIEATAPGEAPAPPPPPRAETPPKPVPEPFRRPESPPSERKADKGGEFRVDAGPSPRFKPTAETDTSKAVQKEEQAKQQARSKQAQVAREIQANPGEKKIQPAKLAETRILEVPQSANSVATEQKPELAEYLDAPIPGNVRKMTDDEMAPTLDAAMAEARSKVGEAVEKRDVEYQAKVEETRKEARQLGEKAEADQRAHIEKKRGEVLAKKEEGMAESKRKLGEFDSDISQKRRGEVERINKHIESEEKRADSELNKAEEKARAERRAAEKRKKEEKKKAQKKEDDLPWYKKIAKFFTKIWDKFTEVVGKIIDAAKKAVNKVIDAARNLVTGIIDTLAGWVKSAIQAFTDLVKGLVDTLVGTFFPELAAKINAAIDAIAEEAMAFVDKVAEGLKSAVNELFDTLQKFANAIMTFYESLIMGAIQVIGAVLSGNFGDIPKIIFLNACRSVGLPGEELLAMLERAADKLIYVIKHPGEFFRNLGAAIKKGFNQFMANFGKHVVTALTGWLFGKLGEAGIKIPSEFSLASIFDLVRQVLGLTYEYIRSRAVKILGEDKVELIERVAGYIKKLFTEGPAALWEEFKQYLGDLKSRIMEQASQWIVTTIVKKAIMKIASMLVPGGGFVQAIISIYETVKFFIEKIKEILEVVNSILDSIYQIAKGAIGAAANFIENSMVKTMPLVVDFLARLVGLGGIGEKIRAIIEKLRTPVRKAADFVIKGAAKLVKAGWGKLKKGAAKLGGKLIQWWKQKQKVKHGGDTHTLQFRGEGKSAQLMIASTARPLDEYIDKLYEAYQNNPTIVSSLKELKRYSAIIDEISDYQDVIYDEKTREYTDKKTGQKKTVPNYFGKNAGETISMALREIASRLTGLPALPAGSKLDGEEVGEQYGQRPVRPPTTIPIWAATSHNGYVDGYMVKAEPLSIDPGSYSGSAATYRSSLYKAVSQRKKGGKSVYVQGHLLNHHLYGTGGQVKNLTPIPSLDNHEMERRFETHAKRLVLEKNRVISYKVEVEYGSRPNRIHLPAEKYLATKLDFRLGEMGLKPALLKQGMSADDVDQLKLNPSNWEVQRDIPVQDLPITLPDDKPIDQADQKVVCKVLDLTKPIPDNLQHDERELAYQAAKAALMQVRLIGVGTAETLLAGSFANDKDVQKAIGAGKRYENLREAHNTGVITLVYGGGSQFDFP